MQSKVCPLVNAFKICGGFSADDDDQSIVVKVGGLECVIDNVSWYINTRLIDLARFELARPDLASCKQKYNEMFGPMLGKDKNEIIAHIISETKMGAPIFKQFAALLELIAKLEDLIIAKTRELGKLGRPINVTLPDVRLTPNVDEMIVYDPRALHAVLAEMTNYVNNININTLLRAPFTQKIPPPSKFSPPMTTGGKFVDGAKRQNVEGYIAAMRSLMNEEVEMSKYAQEIERYYCVAIRHMNEIGQAIGQIIGDFILDEKI